MAPRRGPTEEDRLTAIQRLLNGLAHGVELADIELELEPLHPKNNTFPGEVLLELAADALEVGGISRECPVEYEGIRERHLPEVEFRGKAMHHRSQYALRAVTMIRAGITPDLIDEISWWSDDDLWIWSLYALVIYIRVAATQSDESVPVICRQLAERHGLALSDNPTEWTPGTN